MIKAIAIDDEPPALKVLEFFCGKTDFLSLEKTFTQPNEALKYLRKFPVDLLFLDINMPSLSGIDFYKSVEQNTMVIFTTAYSEFAVEGFNLNAVDYLLKPYTFERFMKAVNKANEYHNFVTQTDSPKEQYLFIRADYSLIKILISDIIYIEGLDDYIKIHIQDQKPVVARMTMKGIMEKLPSKDFIRVHRSFIVAFKRVKNVRNKVISLDQIEISIGSSYEKDFFKAYQN
jgi:DNA-binding LytR/AlgR family response regulator